MDFDFKAEMLSLNDEDLIKIVTIDRENYQSDAVVAAEAEIIKRNIEINKFEQVKNDLKNRIEEQKELDTKRVNPLVRIIHFLVDTTLFFTIAILLYSILGLFINFSENLTLFKFWNYLILAIAFLGYYIFMEAKYQTTVGKIITKTKVVTKDGKKPEFTDIVRRTLFRLIPVDQISFLFLSEGFHDYLSETTIVKKT
jgi:uncharacterized RDD family membrane protein YckC